MQVKTSLTLALSFLVLTSTPLAQGKSGDKIPDVAKAVRHDKSRPLREMAPKIHPQGPPREIQNFRKIRSTQPVQSTPGMDPVRQMSAEPASEMGQTPLSISFEGTSDEDNEVVGGGRIVPPDTEGDVGLDYYIQMNNVVFEVFEKDGNSVYGPVANNTLWSGFGGVCEDLNNGDPVVFYDQLADRWVFSQLAIGNQSPVPGEADGHQCVAVSATDDPTGPYYRYDFRVSPSQDGGYSYYAINDYPKLGLWPDGYYVTVNEFQCQNVWFWTICTYSGARVAALERDRMLAGEAAGMVSFLLPGDQNFSLQPSHWEGPTPPPEGSPNHFLQIFDSEDNGSTGDDGYRLWDFSVDWKNPGLSRFESLEMVPTVEFDSNLCGYAACVPQPSPGELLDTLSQFTMFRVMYRNFAGSHEALVVNHTVDADGNDTAGIRWAELRKTQPSGPWTLHQTGTFAPDDGMHRWMGSIAMDGAGNIALSYSLSGTTQFPSLAYATRCAGDPLGELLGGEQICHWGSGSQTGSSNRWGDYSTISVDPVDDRTFWFTNEYYKATGGFDFYTRICVIPPLDCGGGTCEDNDGDGWTTCDGDCNDDDDTINPGATEICDGIDHNCNGATDDVTPVATTCGVGACAATGTEQCENGALVDNCSPGTATTEICNDELDNDCDELTDLDDSDCCADKDGDTYNDSACGGVDCDDGDAGINPGAAEVCDGADNNCNGSTDEGFDVDGDGYRTCDGDCNDGNSSVNPGAIEICGDEIDNDCDDGDAVCPPGVPPTAPTNLTAAAGSEGKKKNLTVFVNLAWSHGSADAVQFVVERAIEEGRGRNKQCGADLVVVPDIDTASFHDDTVAKNTSYCYQVMAQKGSELSGPSNVAKVKTAK